MRAKILSLLFAFVALSTLVYSQDMSAAFKRRLFDADQLFENQQYLRALSIYDSLWDLRPNDPYLQYHTGVCHIYQATGREEAYSILKDMVGMEGFNDVTFYLARAKHLNYQFEEAIELYDAYITNDRPTGTRRIETLQYIENCKNGIELMKRRLALSLEILTPPSNDKNSQYSPVISPDGNRLYYTNTGPSSSGDMQDDRSKSADLGIYYEDVFVAENIGTDEEAEFTEGKSVTTNINKSDRHEAPMSISYDNQMLFLYLSGSKESEDIYVSYNEGDTSWTKPVKLDGVNTPQWEGHASLSPDGKTLYFSTDRPGGYGGRDIYTAELQDDSTFSNVKNLGSKINTPFNEDAPFIFADGSSLYFSSEAHGSMGGYDIFHVKYDSVKQAWEEPVNMGYPINTTDDDRYYYISANGEQGYFSSARASGENLHDIYRIAPGTFERLHALVLLVGTVYINDERSPAMAKIMDDQTGDVLATLLADSTTGEFAYSLLPGRNYKISLLADGFPPKVEYVDVPALTEGVTRIEHRFDFYTVDYLARKQDSMSLQDELDSKLGAIVIPEDVCLVGKEREELTEEEIESGCYFRVQVGAYRNPGKFKYEFLRSLGDVEIKGSSDGITRYLMGQKFTKRSEAEVLRQKCIAAGQWDAWITVRR